MNLRDLAVCLVILPLVISVPGFAQTPLEKALIAPKKVLVVDYSGSIGGLSGVVKELTSQVLEISRKDHPSGSTAVVQFGGNYPQGRALKNKEQGAANAARSCRDIHTRAPLLTNRSYTPTVVAEVLGRFPRQTRGDTPIIESLRFAEKAIGGDGSIILITDFDEYVCSVEDPAELCGEYAPLRESFEHKNIHVSHIVALSRSAQASTPITAFGDCVEAEVLVVDSLSSARQVAAKLVRDNRVFSTAASLTLELVPKQQPLLIPRQTVPLHLQLETKDLKTSLGWTQRVQKIEGLPPQKVIVAGNVYGHPYKSREMGLRRGENKTLAIPVSTIALTATVQAPEGGSGFDPGPVTWTIENADDRVTVTTQGAELNASLIPGIYNIQAATPDLGGSATVTARPSLSRLDQAIVLYPLSTGVAGTPSDVVLPDPTGPSPTNSYQTDSSSADPEAGTSSATPPSLAGRPTAMEKGLVEIRAVVAPNFTSFATAASADLFFLLVNAADPNKKISLRKDDRTTVETDQRYEIYLTDGERLEKLGEIDTNKGNTDLMASPRGTAVIIVAHPQSNRTKWVLTNGQGEQAAFEGAKLSQYLPPGLYQVQVWQGGRYQSRRFQANSLLSGDLSMAVDFSE